MVRAIVLGLGVMTGAACSVILDFDLDVECWCGERWIAQIAGAEAFNVDGAAITIPASETTYEFCATQREHIALDLADLQDPLYVALRNNLESGAVANCELAGSQQGWCSSPGPIARRRGRPRWPRISSTSAPAGSR